MPALGLGFNRSMQLIDRTFVPAFHTSKFFSVARLICAPHQSMPVVTLPAPHKLSFDIPINATDARTQRSQHTAHAFELARMYIAAHLQGQARTLAVVVLMQGTGQAETSDAHLAIDSGYRSLDATALVATATDIGSFDSGRQFAAWLGLTPRQTGTGSKIRQLGISKRGDPYVRTLLMHGARAIIARSTRSAWVVALLARRPYNVVVAALANRLARTAWVPLIKGKALIR